MADHASAGWIGDLLADVRFGWRMLRRGPAFAVAAIVTLALGIGANTAMFSVADGLLFRPPPFDHPERLYWIYDVNSKLHLTVDDAVPPSPGNFLDWRAQRHAFDYMVAWQNWFFSVAGVSGHELAAEQVRGVTVTPEFFDMLGVRAALGRTFRSDEEQPGRDLVVVLTDGFWQRHFGGDRAVVGQSVLIDGRRMTIIGILPKDFYFLWRDSAIFVPMTVDATFQSWRATHSIAVLGRRAAGITRRDAQVELERIGQDLERAYPATNDGWTAAVVPVFPLNKNLQPALLMLLGAVGCVADCVHQCWQSVAREGWSSPPRDDRSDGARRIARPPDSADACRKWTARRDWSRDRITSCGPCAPCSVAVHARGQNRRCNRCGHRHACSGRDPGRHGVYRNRVGHVASSSKQPDRTPQSLW